MSLLVSKGPALAGLFFALILTRIANAEPAKLSATGQQQFRNFVETFTPLVLKRERKSGSSGPPAGNFRWGARNRDCAGLVRYIFWEAFEEHNVAFYTAYPEMSALVAKASPEFKRISRQWAAQNFTAGAIKSRARFIGRMVPEAGLKTGDLFYFESHELAIRHVMVVIRTGASVYLVYHTGDGRNELRIRSLADLLALPAAEWHPEAENPTFYGVFRPSFLD